MPQGARPSLNLLALQAAARRFQPPPTSSGLEFTEGLFDKQQAVYGSVAQFLALQCGRRAGKTDLLAKRCLASMVQHPGANEWTGYICLTKGAARRNLAGVLQELIDAYGLPITQHEVDGQIIYQHSNGHRLWLGGVDDLRKTERWRGNKWRFVAIDEAGSMPDPVLIYLVQTILKPALSDYGGTLWIAGSPGVIEKGFFHDITTGKNPKRPQWETHHWNCLDNPFHPYGQAGGRAKLDAYRESEGWGVNDPTFVREWLGLWCSDPDALIYPWDTDRNGILANGGLPDCDPSEWRWGLGVDIGWNDDTAFSLTCSRSGLPQRYITRVWGSPEMLPPQIAAEILRTKEQLVRAGFRAPQVAFDTGGLGLMIAKDLEKTYGIFVGKAVKRDKEGRIRAVRGGLTSGTILAHEVDAVELIQEWSALPWDDKRHEHHPKYPDHKSDATLYSLDCHGSIERWDHEEPVAGSVEAINAQGSRHKKHLERLAELNARLRGARDPGTRQDIAERIESEKRRFRDGR